MPPERNPKPLLALIMLNNAIERRGREREHARHMWESSIAAIGTAEPASLKLEKAYDAETKTFEILWDARYRLLRSMGHPSGSVGFNTDDLYEQFHIDELSRIKER